MIEIKRDNKLSIDSEGNLIFFELNEYGKIKYSVYDTFNIYIKTFILNIDKVLNYSVTIDKNDRIHLIALIESGELIYFIYKNNTWSNTRISKFDLQANIYKDIYLKEFNNNINIIYNFANIINSNLWSIKHLLNKENTWTKHNVISLYANINATYFSIDIDSFGILHLLYTTMDKSNLEVYHKSYNPFSKQWTKVPKKISHSRNNKQYPYIFIDNKNNFHSLWIESINNINTLKYYKLSPKIQGKYIWEEIQIPYINNCSELPIIFEEDNILKIIYTKDNEIGYLYSTDYGILWNKGDTIKIESEPIQLVAVDSNSKNSNNIKINHLYCSIKNKEPVYYFVNDLHNKPKNDIKILSSNNTNNVDLINKKETQQNIKQILKNQNEIKETLHKIDITQNEIKEIVEKINIEEDSFLNKLFKPR